MKLHLTFLTFLILAILGAVSFSLAIHSYQVGQYEVTFKMLIPGAVAFAGMMLYVWIWKSS